MIKRFGLFLLLFMALQPLHAKEWYVGGNLHDSTLSQWSAATERNKLATASDWIVTVLGDNQVANMNMLKIKANTVVDCIDKLIPVVSKNYNPAKTKTNTIGLLCIRTLEKNGWR